ncbi:MAG: hypothetical protein ACOYB4_05410 [Methyloceanibacter sp.]
MRIGKTAAAAFIGALLLAASHAAHAAPLVNLPDGVQSSTGMVDLVRKGGGGGGAKFGGGSRGMAMRGGGGGAKFRGGGGGPRVGVYSSGGRYAGRGYRGGNWARSGGNRVYAGKGRGNYGKYAGRGYNKGRYYRRGYPYVWGGLALSGAYYGSNCGWLYRQAQATGSAYWWQRFQDCQYYN